jgi:hypothetical protein
MADYHLTTKYNERSMLRTESEIENEIKKEKKIIKYDEQMAAGVSFNSLRLLQNFLVRINNLRKL